MSLRPPFRSALRGSIRGFLCLLSILGAFSSLALSTATTPLRPVPLRQMARTAEVSVTPSGWVVRHRDLRDGLGESAEQSSTRTATLQGTLTGLEQAGALLRDTLGWETSAGMEILLADIDRESELLVSARPGRAPLLVLAESVPGGFDLARRAAVRGLTEALAQLGPTPIPSGWVAPLGGWATYSIDGVLAPRDRRAIEHHLADLRSGLFAEDAGAISWLIFLEEAYGIEAVGAFVGALQTDGVEDSAIDRALSAHAGGLASAFREFHLWSLFVGQRDDGEHFSFADQVETTRFDSEALGLPTLSLQSNPPLAPWGAAQIRLEPNERRGGLGLFVEGGFPGEWSADLLLLRGDGVKQRLRLPLQEGRGDLRVPLQDIEQAWLLIRRLGDVPAEQLTYTFAAHHERRYPVEYGAISVGPAGAGVRGNQIAWETLLESDLLGFQVQRTHGDAPFSPISTVWIPAVGDGERTTGYVYVDREALPDRVYRYRLQVLTRHGLLVESPVVLSPTR